MKSRTIMKNVKMKLTAQKTEIEKLKGENRELMKKISTGWHFVFVPQELCWFTDDCVIDSAGPRGVVFSSFPSSLGHTTNRLRILSGCRQYLVKNSN